nr:hypothetical protein [Campylobacter lari]
NNAGNVNGGVSSGAAINIGQNNQNGATINNFTNSGTIGDGSNKFAITVWGKSDSKSTIETFNNSGLIQSGSGEAIYLGNTTINDFTNSGTIKSTGGVGVNVASGTNISTLNNKGSISGNISLASAFIGNLNNSGTGFISSNKDAISLKQQSTIESLTNQGTIIGGGNGVFNSGSTIESLTNQGTIYGSVSGVKNLGHINLIDNSGTIQGKDYYGIYANSGTIQTINNQENGLIVGNQSGIHVERGAKVNTILNKGTIQGKNGIRVDGKADVVINTGIIIAKEYNQNLNNHSSGILLFSGMNKNASIKTIDNQGTILTYTSGIGVLGAVNNSNTITAEVVENSGTIRFCADKPDNSTQEGYGQGAGIYMGNFNGVPKVQTINNTGLMDVYNGMYFSLGTQVQTINNSGTIIAKKDGIALGNDDTSAEQRQTKIDNINNTGTIQAGRYGIFIDVAKNPKVPFQIGKINLDGLVYGGVAGFYIGANQKLTEDITVKGTLSGGTAGIINKGIIGTENDPSKGGIKLQGGLISASNSLLRDDIINPAILNAGDGIIYGNTELDNNSKIVGGIVNTDKGKLQGDILVKGGSSISGGIINTGSGVVTGSIKIEGSNSAIEGGIINDGEGKLEGSIEVSNGGKLDNIVNQGSGAIGGDIKVEGGGKVDNIVNNGNGQINGGINVGEGSSVGGITNSGNGNISGDIKNDGDLGTINNSGSISGSIENNNGDLNIKNDGDLGGSITIGDKGGNTSISNGSNGNIGGGIINNGDGNIDVDNKGTVHP